MLECILHWLDIWMVDGVFVVSRIGQSNETGGPSVLKSMNFFLVSKCVRQCFYYQIVVDGNDAIFTRVYHPLINGFEAYDTTYDYSVDVTNAFHN